MADHERELTNEAALRELVRDRSGFTGPDRDRFSPNSRFAEWSPEKRQQAADNFGANWASVLSGHGDQ
jgi:hypothetical protein